LLSADAKRGHYRSRKFTGFQATGYSLAAGDNHAWRISVPLRFAGPSEKSSLWWATKTSGSGSSTSLVSKC